MAETTAGREIRNHVAEPDPFDGAHDGHDESLIRWFLSLTPMERLRHAQSFANGVARIRRVDKRR